MDLESKNFNFREKLIKFISRIMEVDIETTSKYFYRWLSSTTIVAKFGEPSRVGVELCEYLKLKKEHPNLPEELAKKFGIYCLGRYSEDFLLSIIQSYEDHQNQYMLSVVATWDHNGVAADAGKNLAKIQKDMPEGSNLLVMEAGSYFEVIRWLSNRVKDGYKLPSIIHILAHGDAEGFALSNLKTGSFETKELTNLKLQPFLSKLKEEGITIILDSCSTGLGSDSLGEVALRHDFQVLAPNNSINRGTEFKLYINKEGRLGVQEVRFKSIKSENNHIIVSPRKN
jgi:hypothetical protein